MSLFSEQIKQRTENDRNVVEDSFFSLAGVIMDKWDAGRQEDKRLIAKGALDEILKRLKYKPVEIPEEIRDAKEQLKYILRPTGLMVREVDLTEGWQNNAYGPMLGYTKEAGVAVALIPNALHGYHYKDPATGRKTRVTRKTAKNFAREAVCFYQPLPMKKLGIPDLLLYMKNSISASDVILIAIATLAMTLVGMIEPKVYSLVTGSILKTRNLNLMIGMAAFLVCSAFASQLIGLIQELLMQRINTKTSMSVEASVMMRILSLPVSFFRGFSSGELASRASSVNSLCSMMLSCVLSAGLSSLMSLLYVAQIFSFAPALVWPSVIIIVLTIVVSLTATFLQIGLSRKMMKLSAEESGMSFSILNGIQKIRLSGAEKRVFARWARLYSKEARLTYNPPAFLKLNSVITTAISLFGTVMLYYLAVSTGVAENQYYAFTAAYGRVSGAFTALAGIIVSVASIRPVLEMAEPILKAEPEVASDKRFVDSVSGNINMNHVSFRYTDNTPYVLEDLNLSIKQGEYIAIVGRTGCGKSTLVRLLLGFEKPEKGAVYYDNFDLADVDPRSLRKNIGVVIQNGQLFQGDIFSNIVISAPQLTRDDAWEAAEIAGIADDIRDMPMGMETMISEGQGGISGGQKQRLMIARAIAPKPKILIFDEATSALDNKTQKQVSDALDKLKCTRIVIAHRLSTIRNCDRILVMDNGKIIEEGTYDDLIAKEGSFAELVARQRLDS
ncbi:MAG: NHLP bacteriocin export ABC transporter permease/ATPase subunit [Ruminococcaceae bacterium]|nr:NHLP bacteriocin export ABC transporter permease/ATPase subunit [Oscillospiraceae bacterium]